MDTVTLRSNSIYVCLQQLLSEGFHWALLVVDASGRVERHHWSQSKERPTAGRPIEVYTHALISTNGVVPTYTVYHTCNLVYLRIRGYTAPPAHNPFDFAAAFNTIFTTSYDNVRENRYNHISCRTWVRYAMQMLRDTGLLVRGDSAIQLEAAITAAGKRIEPMVASALGSFVAVVEDV